MNSLQAAALLQQRSRAALRELNTSALFSLGGVAAALLITLGAGAGAAEMLAGAHAGAVLAFSLVAWLAIYSVLEYLKRVHDGIRASIRDSNTAAQLRSASQQINFFRLILKLILTASACALSSRASAAKSRIRARTPDAGRVLSSVRDLFARTVAHLRAVTSTLRLAGSGSFRAV